MRTATARIRHTFAKPPERIFAHLSEHENLERLFGAKITRLRDGDDGHRNGVGSARRLRIGPLPSFEETVTEFEPDSRIVYTITRGTPLDHHLATLTFTPTDAGGTELDYTIRMGSKLPLLAPLVKTVLQRNITAALPKVDASA